jgi:hypothetical protein
MSLNVSLAITIALPDGQTLVQVIEADTSINPQPEDIAAETLLAKHRLDDLLTTAHHRATERLDEVGALLDRTNAKA